MGLMTIIKHQNYTLNNGVMKIKMVKIENQKVMVKNQKKVEMAINQEVEKVNGKNGGMMMIGKGMMMMTTTSKKVVKKEKNTTSREMVVMVKVKVKNQKVMVKNQKKVEMAINQEVEKVNG